MSLLPLRTRLLVYAVAAAGAVALGLRAPDVLDWQRTDWLACVALVAIIVVAQQFQLPLRHRTETENFSMIDAVWAGSLLLVRPSVLIVAVAVGVSIGQVARGWSPHKTGFNVGQDVVAVSLALVAYEVLAGPAAPSEPRAWGAAAAGMVAFFVVNVSAVPLAISLTEGTSFRAILRAVLWLNVLQAAGNVALGILAGVVALEVPAALPLLAVPLFLSWLAYTGWLRSLRERDRMEGMARTAEEISEQGDLSKRIAAAEGDDAIDALAGTLNSMLDRLEQSYRRERRFIDEVSHELRTPITICRGHLEVLGPDPSSGDLRDTIELVLDELDRAGRIIGDLATLAQSEEPRFVRPELVFAAEFLQEVATKAALFLDGRLEVVPAPDDAVLRGDPQRLTQALINLLHNAAVHARGDDPVALRLSELDSSWRFEVEDHGGGLPRSLEEQVFQPFVRGTTSAHGSGLGLAIVRHIAKAHGGEAGIVNRPGYGITAWLSLPKELAAAIPEPGSRRAVAS